MPEALAPQRKSVTKWPRSTLLASSGLYLHAKTKSPRQVEGPQALLSAGHRTAGSQPARDTALLHTFTDPPAVMPKAVTAHRAPCSKVPAALW